MPLQWQKAAVSLVCRIEAETKHGVSSTAATSWWLVTAGLYCRQMSIGATAVATSWLLSAWPKADVSLVCSTEADTKHGVSSTAATSCRLVCRQIQCRLVLQAACQ